MAVERRARRSVRRLALLACALGLAYGIMKVILAARGEVGMPGFPPSARTPTEGIAARQLGNAAFGFVAAALALLPLVPSRRHIPRMLHALLHLGGGLAILAGSAGLALRSFGLAAPLGPPPVGPLGPLVAALGLLWAGAWLALAWAVWRER